MIKPNRLRKNDVISIVSPASPPDYNALHTGIKTIKEVGFNTYLSHNTVKLRIQGMFSSSLKDRLDDFHKAINSDCSAIISSQGGIGSAMLLPYLDYDAISKHPKIFMGCSDITVLCNAIFAKSNLVSFLGPCACVYEQPCIDSFKLALNLLSCCSPWKSEPFMLNNQVVATVCPGEAKGHAIGGNLHVFMSLIGTPYLPETKGAILFIEDTGATGHHLYGMLQHLKLAGILENLNGVVVGEYVERPDVEDAGDNSVEQVLVEFFKDGPPCISGLNFSHGDFNAVIPIGAPTFLDANNRIVEFDFNML